jgi:PAS domain S-box-containing protein
MRRAATPEQDALPYFLTVSCLEEKPVADEGPFLANEVELLDNIARQLIVMIQRDRAMQRELHLNAVLRSIRDVNQLIVREKHRGSLIEKACSILVGARHGLQGAWMVLTDQLPDTMEKAQTGFDPDNFAAFTEQIRQGALPACCLRESAQESVVITFLPDTECGDCPLANTHGGNACMSAALHYNGKKYGCMGVSVPPEFADDAEEESLLAEIAGDLSFALYSLEQEAARRDAEKELKQFEWLLEKEAGRLDAACEQYDPPYDDVTALNTRRVILDAVGRDTLTEMGRDLMDLLDTSVAVYEKNGDYACGIFDSAWCRLFDTASFALCGTDDTRKALDGGRWLCHENCWNDSARAAIESGKPSDMECVGGIRLYAVPIHADGEIIGAVNIGYGTPPRDEAVLSELAKRFKTDVETVRRAASEYKPRPQYIIDVARRRCRSVARRIGERVERQRVENSLRESEKGLREAQRLANIGNWALNRTTGEVYLSDEMYNIIGLEQNDGAGDVTRHEKYYTPESWQHFLKVAEHAYQTGESYEIEMEVIREKERNRTVVARGESLTDEQGKIIGLRGTLQDITARKQAEEELRYAKNAAEAASRAKSAFLANMSHELRTPLNPVIGFTDMVLKDKNLTDEQREFLGIVSRRSRDLLRLLSDILDIARIEERQLSVKPVEVDVREVIRDVMNMFAYDVKAKELHMTACIDRTIEQPMLIDPVRLRQMLFNLVGNAVKFTEQGDIEVSAELLDAEADAGQTPSPDHSLLISVRDTGCGIAPEQQQRIFESFQQADDSYSRKYGGAGLGLSICRRLADLMNGRIWVESELGRGSTFHVQIPVKLARAKQKQDPLREPAASSPTAASLHILLAEDDEDSAVLTRHALEQADYKLTWVKDGDEAVHACATGAYDLVLMDVKMPRMDGMQATRAIRAMEQDRHVPILALTAHAYDEDREACLAAGMDNWLPKPVSVDMIHAAVAESLSIQPEGKQHD